MATKLAFSSSRSGDPEIWVADASGANPRRLTNFSGPDVSPVWNPKTNAQIAWCSGRTGLPQIYIMDSDGGDIQRMTDGGYATSPSWSPNGQFLTFAWDRKYGPGAPGGQDIYVMDIASKRWLQLTHDAGTQRFSQSGRRMDVTSSFERAQGGQSRDMDHAGRRHRAASTDPTAGTTPCRTGVGSKLDLAARIDWT